MTTLPSFALRRIPITPLNCIKWSSVIPCLSFSDTSAITQIRNTFLPKQHALHSTSINASKYQQKQEQLAYSHFQTNHSTSQKLNPKFKSPRRRASKLYNDLQMELVAESAKKNKNVVQVNFSVGDAIEIKKVSEGGVKSSRIETFRGIVMGRYNRGLNSSFTVRHIAAGQAVDYKLPLHSPLLKSIKILKTNALFYKKKPYCKRAKLFYLNYRPAEFFRVDQFIKRK